MLARMAVFWRDLYLEQGKQEGKIPLSESSLLEMLKKVSLVGKGFLRKKIWRRLFERMI
jgi:hypothetical protein